MKSYSYYVLFLLVVFCGCSRPTELTSPDGNIKLVFNLNEAGVMTYGVSVGGKPFITPSAMGFEGRDGLNLSKDFQIENTEFTTKMKPGPSLGGRINLSGTIITRWLCA